MPSQPPLRLHILAAALALSAPAGAFAQSPDVTTTPEAVYREWNDNEAAARARYAGKIVQVAGSAPIVSLSQFAGSSSVWFRASYQRVVTCTFEDANKAELEAMTAGAPVTVVGRFSGFGPSGLGLSGCRVVNSRGASAAAPVAAAASLPSGTARPPLGDYAVYQGTAGGFDFQYTLKLSAGGEYRTTSGGGSGRYAYDVNTRRLTFASGPLQGFGGFFYARSEPGAAGEPAIALSARGAVDPNRINGPGITGYQYAYLRR